jgi:hypothetical protein
MKIPALIAVLLLGSGSLVAAAPAERETTERVSYTGLNKPPAEPEPEAGWLEIASPTPANHGRELINVDAKRSFTRLRLEAATGRPIVRTVRIYYKDGTSQLVRIDRTLDKQRDSFAVIDLRGARAIEQVVITADRDSKGTYTVQGEVEKPGVAAR